MLRVSKEQAGSLYKDKDTGQSVKHPIKGFSTAEGAVVCWLSLFIFFFLASLPSHLATSSNSWPLHSNLDKEDVMMLRLCLQCLETGFETTQNMVILMGPSVTGTVHHQ